MAKYKIKFRHYVNEESDIIPKEEVVILESEYKEESKQFFKELKRMYEVVSLGFTDVDENSLKFIMNYRNEDYYLNFIYELTLILSGGCRLLRWPPYPHIPRP